VFHEYKIKTPIRFVRSTSHGESHGSPGAIRGGFRGGVTSPTNERDDCIVYKLIFCFPDFKASIISSISSKPPSSYRAFFYRLTDKWLKVIEK
jgi:hypothetical protein